MTTLDDDLRWMKFQVIKVIPASRMTPAVYFVPNANPAKVPAKIKLRLPPDTSHISMETIVQKPNSTTNQST